MTRESATASAIYLNKKDMKLLIISQLSNPYMLRQARPSVHLPVRLTVRSSHSVQLNVPVIFGPKRWTSACSTLRLSVFRKNTYLITYTEKKAGAFFAVRQMASHACFLYRAAMVFCSVPQSQLRNAVYAQTTRPSVHVSVRLTLRLSHCGIV